MKECDRVCDEMMDYLRGIMDKQRATATYKHLNTCGVCADKIKDFYLMVKLIKFLNLINFKAPEGHRQAIMKMVQILSSHEKFIRFIQKCQ